MGPLNELGYGVPRSFHERKSNNSELRGREGENVGTSADLLLLSE